MDVIWSLVLEEGRGGFMDSARYREVMTGLFFHGEAPPEQPKERTASKPSSQSKPAARAPRPPRKSKVDELREFTRRIAARNATDE